MASERFQLEYSHTQFMAFRRDDIHTTHVVPLSGVTEEEARVEAAKIFEGIKGEGRPGLMGHVFCSRIKRVVEGGNLDQ